MLKKGIERSSKMQKFIRKPSIDLYLGVKVTKDTTLEYENKNVKQSLKDLVFHSVTKVKGDNFESVYDTTINLQEGDILLFEEESRGYIMPVDKFVTIQEAIDDYENIKDLGGD
jgi:hypothetical protein